MQQNAEDALLTLFPYLKPTELLIAGQLCKNLRLEAEKDFLWKGHFPPNHKPTWGWKFEYVESLRLPRKWMKQFTPLPTVAVCSSFDESTCVRVMYDKDGAPKFYLGGYEGLFQLKMKKKSGWKAVPDIQSTLDIKTHGLSHHSHLLAAATLSHIHLFDTSISDHLIPDSMVGKMEVPAGLTPRPSKFHWMTIPKIGLEFSGSGRSLFSTSSGLSNGVTMWDVETQTPVHVFNHHSSGEWEMEESLFGSRSKHQIHGVAPTYQGDQFVSTSYDYFYHWDTRSKNQIRQHTFYSAANPGRYQLNDVFLTRNDTELTIHGRSSPKIVSYDFPSMVPTFKQFSLSGDEICALDFNEVGCGFGIDRTGKYFHIFNGVTKETQQIEAPSKKHDSIGTGANTCHISDTGNTIAFSFANSSGWNAASCVAVSTEDLFGQENNNNNKTKADKCKLQ